MKARNPSTGNLETVYVKALDSLPVGAEIDFDGDSADIPTGWEQVDDVPVYSTTETICGTWIDGKPIYRKVITGTIANGSTVLTDIDTLINIYGSAVVVGTKRIIPYYEMYNNTNYGITFQSQSNTNTWQAVIFAAGTGTNATNCKITVEYTKTTD